VFLVDIQWLPEFSSYMKDNFPSMNLVSDYASYYTKGIADFNVI